MIPKCNLTIPIGGYLHPNGRLEDRPFFPVVRMLRSMRAILIMRTQKMTLLSAAASVSEVSYGTHPNWESLGTQLGILP